MPSDIRSQQPKYEPSVVSPSYYQEEIEFNKFDASKWNPVTEEGECGRYYIDIKNKIFISSKVIDTFYLFRSH